MTIYIIHLIAILLVGGLLQPNKSRSRRTLYIVLQCLLLILLYTFRSYTVGRDTYQFVVAFNTINGTSKVFYDRELESGFEWLCFFVGRFSTDYHSLFLVIALFVFGALGYFISKNSRDPILSFYLFATMTLLAFALSSMRQIIAVGFLLLFSEIGLKKNRYITFVVGVVIASLFHVSALLALVFLLFNKIPFNKDFLKITAIACVLLPFVADLVFKIVTLFFPYAVYLGKQEYYGANIMGALFNILIWLFMMLITVAIWLYYKAGIANRLSYHTDAQNLNKHFWRKLKQGKLVLGISKQRFEYSPDFLVWCGAASLLIASVSMKISVCYRAVYYFGIYFLISLPNTIALIENKRQRRQIRWVVIAAGFAVWYIIAAFRPEWYNAVPYVTDLW